ENIAPSLGLPKDMGEIVRSIVAGGPAAKAGLQQGDVILQVNGQNVTPEETVSYLIANTQIGSRANLNIVRGGKRQSVTVFVGERPTEEQLAKLGGDGATSPVPDGQSPATPQRVLGLSLTPLTPELARAANLPQAARGVIITAVEPNSDAADEGLQRGDLIVSVNQVPVLTPAQVVASVDGARRGGRSRVLLLVKRAQSPETFVGIDISIR
ncbi:MAG: PDZ domain-containing protein, partial [Sphingomicrobium sp.]